MQSKTEDFLVNLETIDVQERKLTNLVYYEEYSKRNIDEIVRMRRDDFERAGFKIRKEQQDEVESEIEDFRVWLVETKGLELSTAHYYSVSLKGVLLGIPAGVQLALLFGAVLEAMGYH